MLPLFVNPTSTSFRHGEVPSRRMIQRHVATSRSTPIHTDVAFTRTSRASCATSSTICCQKDSVGGRLELSKGSSAGSQREALITETFGARLCLAVPAVREAGISESTLTWDQR